MSNNDDITETAVSSALKLLKKRVPELCMLVHVAKEMCEIGKQPDTHENTIESMKLILDILISRTKEEIRPDASQLQGWPLALSSKEEDIELAAMRIDKKTAKLMASVRSLEEACQKMEVATRLAQHQYNNSLVLLDELVASAGRGEYKAPSDLNKLINEIKEETEAQVTLEMMRVVRPQTPVRTRPTRVVVAQTETHRDDDSDSLSSLMDSDHSSFGSTRSESRHTNDQTPNALIDELVDGVRVFSNFFESNNTGLIRPLPSVDASRFWDAPRNY